MVRNSSSSSAKKQSTTVDLRRKKLAAVVATAVAAVALHWGQYYDKEPRNVSRMTGQEWMEEQLDGHPGVFYDTFGMHKHVFRNLLKVLTEKTGFSDTKHVSAVEQLGIFLYAVITGLSIRKLENRFQRSKDTITKCVAAFSLL
jgi:hypothetical protein